MTAGTRSAGSWGSRKDTSWARGGVKMSILAYCCCFVLSVRSNVQSPASGIRLLASAMARGPGPWAHGLRLEGPARLEEDVEDAADAVWVPKGLHKGNDIIVPVPPPLAAMTETSDDREAITDLLLSGSPWALVAVRQFPGGGKRHSLSFTPRLGRDEEDGDDGEELGEEEDDSMMVVRRRTPPFAPRLGRRSPSGGIMPFSPRLGRRRTRSGPSGEEVQSPTVGNNPDRNLIFSPRLGRSSSQTMAGSLRSESDGRAQAEESGTKET